MTLRVLGGRSFIGEGQKHYLRWVIYAEFPQTRSDCHDSIARLIYTFCIFRKELPFGGQHAAYHGKSYYAAMQVTRKYEVSAPLGISAPFLF